ncbi:ABC transporter permease [Aciditerrimonas ferrireducens]|uniref:ABC transporter permease n=1 Tax=Aciditerrimonas ferrireducens TaxID=667306 RepID=A0ABV6BYY5_9ACTN
MTRRGRGWRLVVLVGLALYFVVPLLASARFSLEGSHGAFTLDAYRRVVDTPGFWSSLGLSLEVGLGTALVELALTLGTSLWVHLRAPSWQSVVDTVVLVPLMVPVVVLVLGVTSSLRFLPSSLTGSPAILVFEYAVLALPYVYRIVDAGVSALDLRTLVDATGSLGGGWLATLRFVLLPSLRRTLLAAGAMTVALALGEYVMASLLSIRTFPVWLEQLGTTHAAEAVAVSMLSLVGTLVVLGALVLVATGRAKGRRSATPAVSGSLRLEEVGP